MCLNCEKASTARPDRERIGYVVMLQPKILDRDRLMSWYSDTQFFAEVSYLIGRWYTARFIPAHRMLYTLRKQEGMKDQDARGHGIPGFHAYSDIWDAVSVVERKNEYSKSLKQEQCYVVVEAVFKELRANGKTSGYQSAFRAQRRKILHIVNIKNLKDEL